MKKKFSLSDLENDLTPEQFETFLDQWNAEGLETALENLPDMGDVVETVTIANRNIKQLRLENGLTQTDLANVLNVSQKEYWRYEQDGYSINILTLGQIAIFYNVSLDWISGICNKKKPVYEDSGTFVNGYVLEEMKTAKASGYKYYPYQMPDEKPN